MSRNVVSGLRQQIIGRELIHSAFVDPFFANLALIASFSVMFTVSDAFETGALGLLHSALLWMVVSILLVVQTCLSHRLFLSFFSKTPVIRICAAAIALSATVLLMAAELHWLKFTPLLPKDPDPFFDFVFFVAQPVLAAGCLTLLSQSNAIQKYINFLQNRETAGVDLDSDFEMLARVLRQHDVLRVSAQDHYLEIFTGDQKFLLRGRMKDAMSALKNCAGMQVHRSHWVARRHVKQLRRQGRDTRLVLRDGYEVPVARSRYRSIQKFGQELN